MYGISLKEFFMCIAIFIVACAIIIPIIMMIYGSISHKKDWKGDAGCDPYRNIGGKTHHQK